MTTSRPTVALAMRQPVADWLFDEPHLRRLAKVAELVDDGRPLTSLADERALDVLATVEVLLTGWGVAAVDEAVLDVAPSLRAIVHSAGTVKGFISPACWDRGIRVTSIAAGNAVPVAEFTLAAIILANKNAFLASSRMRSERRMPRRAMTGPPPGNVGKRVGIIGASRVGRLVIGLLQATIDVEVGVADPLLSAEGARELGATLVELDELLATSDVVSLHAPLLPETTGMIDARRLGLIRDGVTFINTARGAIVDSAALEHELVSGRINAVIDTTFPEPLPNESPLYDLENVFLTPHLAGSQGTELARLADGAIEEIERYAAGEPFVHNIAKDELPWIA